MAELTLTSSAFTNNDYIPVKNTCEGDDQNPPLTIDNVPDGAKSMVLIVDDPDAPGGTWVHWVVWNIAPRTRDIGEGVIPPEASEGVNSFKRHAYGGPCPPSGTHRYFFKLYALDTALNLGANSAKQDVEKAMKGHIISQTQLMGLYQRTGPQRGYDTRRVL
ncbi:MAG TPA: YbhB/YbcL family Raf kinase inhibitor-like protein [Dissulfurispiraceae bacterium]